MEGTDDDSVEPEDPHEWSSEKVATFAEKSRRVHRLGTRRSMTLFFPLFLEMMISRGRLP